MTSGMPPTFEAMIGSPEAIASRFTRPNASRDDGRMNMSADFINCGMFDWRPSSLTWSWRFRFLINVSRAGRCGPSPTIMNLRFCLFAGSVLSSCSIALR